MYKLITKKYLFYCSWYLDLNAEQKKSDTGIWVHERASIFADLLKKMESEVPMHFGPVTNYKNLSNANF